MIKNFFKMAVRHMQKNRLYTFLNVTGLVVAFTCLLLIVLYVRYETGYDRYHKNADNVYRVVQKMPNLFWRGTDMWNATSSILKPTIIKNIPEVDNASTVHYAPNPLTIFHNGKYNPEKKVFFVEPEFLDMFSFPILQGNTQNVLTKPNSILLTESKAKQYFGNKDPIGYILEIGNIKYTVTGVLKDVPKNSHFTFDFLASFQNLGVTEYGQQQNQGGPMRWDSNNFNTYIQVQSGVNPKVLANKISKLVHEQTDIKSLDSFHLQKVTDIHLRSHVNREFEANSDIKYIYIFSAIGILLLIIAGLNYINLTTVQTLFFAKEAGIRKVSGASKIQISLHLIGEAILISFISFIISLGLVRVIIPAYALFVEKELTFNMLLDANIVGLSFLMVILMGFLSGSYPAMLLARKQPLKVLKNIKSSDSKTMGMRSSLVVFQYVITIALVTSTIIILKQLHSIQNRDLGYQHENVVNINVGDDKLKAKYNIFKEELLKHPGVLDVTSSQTSLELNSWGGGAKWEGQTEEEQVNFYQLFVDYNFFDFFNVKLIEGRQFQKDINSDKSEAYIINRKAVETIGWENPIDKQFRRNRDKGKIIGVVDNFHFQSLHLGIEPLAISLAERNQHRNLISVKVMSENIHNTLQLIEDTHNAMSSGYQFSFSFLDEKLNDLYRAEQRQGKIFSIFSLIAIFVAGLGLFGLSSFIAKQRTKEIGIRKVNGAKISEILSMLNRDFIKWVAIAFVVACPIAWYAMNKWLENFAYKTTLSWWIFALAGVLALGIALLTVSWQSWRAATRNPVEALRYE